MNSKTENIVIKFSDIFDISVTSRSAIRNLFNFKIPGVKTVELNFNNILFVSRSAAHQILLESEKLAESGINVFRSNVAEGLIAMFDIVSDRNRKVKNTSKIQIIEIKNDKDFKKIIQAY